MGNAAGVKDDLRSFGVTDYEEYTGWWCRYKDISGSGDEEPENIIARISLHPTCRPPFPRFGSGILCRRSITSRETNTIRLLMLN